MGFGVWSGGWAAGCGSLVCAGEGLEPGSGFGVSGAFGWAASVGSWCLRVEEPGKTKGLRIYEDRDLGFRGLGRFGWAAGVVVWVTSKGLVLG